ncbi:MAG: Hsp20/alpha crystallin family protein [Bacteroidales bacterium]|nr:Hsp20/alpha crystallin family protein [Bacteroidales bacterium]
MLVARRNPSMMPSVFNDFLNWGNWSNLLNEERHAMPKTNISESETDYRMELCVPGLKKEDLSISIDTDNNLVIEMSKKEEQEEKKEERCYLRHEFSETQFKQLFTLPENIKKEQISAKVEHGVLTVTLPKITEEEKKALAQTIEIM